MLKSITDKLRSFFTSSLHNTESIPAGSKRKRSRHECDDDPDIQIVRVEKKRRLETSNSSSIVSSISKIPSKMAEWIHKPKSKRFSDKFHSRPIESSYRWRNAASERNGDSQRATEINGDETLSNHVLEARHNISHFSEIPRNGDMREERNDEHNFNISRRSSNSSISRHNRESTASRCIRLKEKAEYQKLLQLQSRRSPWQPAVPILLPNSHKSSPESDVISISSKSSSGDGSHFSKSYQGHHLSSIPVHRFTHSKVNAPLSSEYLRSNKHETSSAPGPVSLSLLLQKQRAKARSSYTSHHNTVNRSPGSLAAQKSNVNSSANNQTASVVTDGKNAKVNDKGPPAVEDSSTIVIDDDDDDDDDETGNRENVSSQSMKGVIESQRTVTDKDSTAQSSGECSLTSFLRSKYLNDRMVDDERKSRQEEQERRKREMEDAESKMKAYAEKRRAQELSLERELKYKMRIFDEEPEVSEEIFLEEEPEEEEETLPELTDEMENMVRLAMRPGNPNEVLAEGYRLQITRRDIATLSGLNWLNDEVGRVGKPNWLNDQVINFYMNMLMERGAQEGKPDVYAFNTFFYPKIMKDGHSAVRRWTKNVDIFAKDYIIIPVHLGVHWCLCVVNMKGKKILYYDSMGAKNDACLHAVLKYVNDESVAKKQVPINQSEWKLINVDDNPHQMNGGDCGMFMCKYAEYITRGRDITFTQEDMPYFRRRMVYEIITKKLLQ